MRIQLSALDILHRTEVRGFQLRHPRQEASLRFALHGPALTDPVSTRCHGLPDRDVDRCVQIGVACEAAGDAPEGRLALAALRGDVPARAAPLARVLRVDSANSPARFVFKAREEQAPALRQDAAVEAGLLRDVPSGRFEGAARRARHGAHVEILDLQDIVVAGEAGGRLLHPVLATLNFAGTQDRDGALDTKTSVAATLSAGQAALKPQEPLGFLRAHARSVERLTIAGHDRDGHAEIQPNDLAGPRAFDGGRNVREGNVPPARGVQGYPARCDIGRHITGPAEFDLTDLWDENYALMSAKAPHVIWPDCDDSKAFVLLPLSPRRVAVRSTKEVPERLVEVSEGLLLNGDRAVSQPGVVGSSLGQLSGLLDVAGGGPESDAVESPLLESEVPDEARVRIVAGERLFLRRRRAKTETHLPAFQKGVHGSPDQLGDRQSGFPGHRPQGLELAFGQVIVHSYHAHSLHTSRTHVKDAWLLPGLKAGVSATPEAA